MKILFLTPYNPAPPKFGGAIRIYHILKYLTTHHDVTVIGFGTSKEREEMEAHFPSLKGKVHYIRWDETRTSKWTSFVRSLGTGNSHCYSSSVASHMQDFINRILENSSFDVVQAEFPLMAFYSLQTDAVKILDAHNVEYDNFRRMAEGSMSPLRRLYYKREAEKMYGEEIEAAGRQDAIFACSDRDIQIFNRDLPDIPKFLVPNGVDLNYFRAGQDEPEPNSLVYVGMMKYLPNRDAMNYFLDEIFPKVREKIPDAKITIVGGQPSEELLKRKSKHVEVTGFVEDVRPYIRRASVYVVPLRMGGGTRLKILEAMAMKKPIVSTRIGCEGIDLHHYNSALIADAPRSFADSVVELLKNRATRDRIAQTAFNLAEQTYSWEKVGEQMEKAYTTLLAERRKTNAETKSKDKEPPRFEKEMNTLS